MIEVVSSRTAEIRRLAKANDGSAEHMLANLLSDLFQLDVQNVTINRDQYSLNSLNGFFDTADGAFFFKFHQEEGEEAMSGEYYRADILARAGLPVDQPALMSVLPGEQILVYKRRSDPRFSDVLRALDLKHDEIKAAEAAEAEAQLSRTVLDVYLKTLTSIEPAQSVAEPVHRLFWERLIDPVTRSYPGGRYASYYVGQRFSFPGVDLSWDALSRAKFRINGLLYARTIGELFDDAYEKLNPSALANAGGVTAHGDAHNANVWFEQQAARPHLSYFDPAFAGDYVPSLLAEIKTTFHNNLAHPFWLYDPDLACELFSASASYDDGVLDITTDWSMTPVRVQLLDVKARELWRPLLQALKSKGLLPSDWRTTIRLGLFLCPTLVMNLRAGAMTHNPVSSAIGLAVAVMAGSPPENGTDMITEFLDKIEPA